MKYFIVYSLLFSLFFYSICKNCIDIMPISEEDCVSSTEETENYCCYIKFIPSYSDYNKDDIETDNKCLPFNQNGKEELEDIYDDREKYKTYGYIDYYHCNQNDKYAKNENLCDDINPDKPSDCKLSSSESNNGDVCCYLKEITNVRLCEKHSKTNVDSFIDNNINKYKEIVCISYDYFLKESLLILILFLFF